MSFELRLLVPAPQSVRSTSPTARPRRAASRATPAPVMPPPTTSRSRSAVGSAASVASRVSGENGEAIRRAAWLARRAQLGERGLRLGDLVGAALLACDLQRARGERERFVAIAARFARLREHDARRERVRIDLDGAAEHRFALLRVTAEKPREPEEELPLRRERVGVLRVELERAI